MSDLERRVLRGRARNDRMREEAADIVIRIGDPGVHRILDIAVRMQRGDDVALTQPEKQILGTFAGLGAADAYTLAYERKVFGVAMCRELERAVSHEPGYQASPSEPMAADLCASQVVQPTPRSQPPLIFRRPWSPKTSKRLAVATFHLCLPVIILVCVVVVIAWSISLLALALWDLVPRRWRRPIAIAAGITLFFLLASALWWFAAPWEGGAR